MTNQHACGPRADAEFFADFSALMQKYPHLANKYHVVCVDHETEILKVDFKKQGALRRIEGQTIITEFRPLQELQSSKSEICCGWDCPVGQHCKCTTWWVRPIAK